MSTGRDSLYDVLGVSESADPAEIAVAFRRAVKRWHPDLNAALAGEATERMKHISAAYDVLRDPERRAAYDQSIDLSQGNLTPGFEDAHPEPRTRCSTAPSWRAAAESCPRATVIHDPGPPAGYRIGERRLSLRQASLRVCRAPRATDRCLGARAPAHPSLMIDVVWLAPLPFVPFLRAALRVREPDLAGWTALYALAPPLWVIGAATASSPLELAGRTLLVLGAGHCLCWRRRLRGAIGSSSGRRSHS